MMRIGSVQWIDLVRAGADRLGIAVDENQARQFARHAELLMEWNRKLNLTAIVDPTEIALKHFLDAIAPLAHIPSDGDLLDIGTGGGFPGIPLKIMRPSQPMVLIDGVRKKINFVKQVIRELALGSIEARQIRAEALAREAHQPKFDVVVCRALSDLRQVIRWAGPLLSTGGHIIAYRGPEGSQVSAAGDALSSLKIKGHPARSEILAYQLPILGDSRSITIIKAAP